ncbi:MAG: hypothetical protein E6343_17225 [Clostridium perfringens]|nr:hypothetical protein [Clostridium perfringens]
MDKKSVNMGGLLLDLKVSGMDEVLEKLDLLNKKLEEANSLIKEIASSKVEMNFTSSDCLVQQQDD